MWNNLRAKKINKPTIFFVCFFLNQTVTFKLSELRNGRWNCDYILACYVYGPTAGRHTANICIYTYTNKVKDKIYSLI